MVLATSSALPMRPMGTILSMCSLDIVFNEFLDIGVSVGPGETELHLILYFWAAQCPATLFVCNIIEALLEWKHPLF